MGEILDIYDLKKRLAEFANIRDWKKFHSPKNLSMALAAEAGELLEIFQWLTEQESKCLKDNLSEKKKVGYELADIILYATRIAYQLDINLNTAVQNKLSLNNCKYLVDKVKGSAKKYTEYP